MRDWFKRAFAVDPPGPAVPNEAEAQLVERFAAEVVRRGLTGPALLFLECSHPLNFLTGQFLTFAAPIVQVFFKGESLRIWAEFLDRRGSVEYICRRIEAVANQATNANERRLADRAVVDTAPSKPR